ncbi:hypothetical protein [Cecembia sp.]|uniref:hypothetical protein n=1 Tax=Cecembia sp. TaxID=1898110 RepID=UPI0025C393CA|nr:hypothetical protein [Cecembia sp.]
MSGKKKYGPYFFSLSLTLLLFFAIYPKTYAQLDRGILPSSAPIVYGVVPAEKKLFVYKVNQSNGEIEIQIKNETLENIAFQSVKLSPSIEKIEVDVQGDKAFVLLAYGVFKNYLKTLLVIDLETADYRAHTVQSNFAFPTVFKAFSSAVLMIGVLEEGDVMEIYHFDQNYLITITDFFMPNTRVWDIKIIEDQVDLLLFTGDKKRKQLLQILSFDQEGNRLFNIPLKFPQNKNFFVSTAQLIHGPFQEQKIVGIYSNRYGEWFSGYFQLSINDLLEQDLQLYPYKELEGFYDYLGNNNRSKKPKRTNFNKEMVMVDAATDGEFITIVSEPLRTVKKFAHIISINQDGVKEFDKSVKLFYHNRINPSELQLTNQDSTVYFMFGGNQNRLNPPGKKIYSIKKGEGLQFNQVQSFLTDPSILNYLPYPKFLHWYENKFVFFGLTKPREGRINQSEFIIRKIEV